MTHVATLVTMGPRARRTLAAKWFLQGFRLSGKNFSGEQYDDIKYPALTSILLAEFARIYDAEVEASQNARDKAGAARGLTRSNEAK